MRNYVQITTNFYERRIDLIIPCVYKGYKTTNYQEQCNGSKKCIVPT